MIYNHTLLQYQDTLLENYKKQSTRATACCNLDIPKTKKKHNQNNSEDEKQSTLNVIFDKINKLV